MYKAACVALPRLDEDDRDACRCCTTHIAQAAVPGAQCDAVLQTHCPLREVVLNSLPSTFLPPYGLVLTLSAQIDRGPRMRHQFFQTHKSRGRLVLQPFNHEGGQIWRSIINRTFQSRLQALGSGPARMRAGFGTKPDCTVSRAQ